MSSGSTIPKLVADIGGTNARFALVYEVEHGLRELRVLSCTDFAGPLLAIEHYLSVSGAPRPRVAAIAIATAISGDRVTMTNQSWEFSIEELRREMGLERLLVLNDFSALALSLPYLDARELRKVGGGEPVRDAPLAVIGAGTGLGVSGLVPAHGSWVALDTEGGHVSFSPANAREADILRIVWRDYPHVSAERLVSGIGLENLLRAIAELRGETAPALSPAQAVQHALAGDPLCKDVIDTLCAMLGTAAANLVLTLGARGGLYIGGGIVPKLGGYFDHSPFRRRFIDKGRFSAYLAAVPSFVILSESPALLGAARALATREI